MTDTETDKKPRDAALFFQSFGHNGAGPIETEITLRDLFAAFAVTGIIAADDNCNTARVLADIAYDQADAMLAEREKRS